MISKRKIGAGTVVETMCGDKLRRVKRSGLGGALGPGDLEFGCIHCFKYKERLFVSYICECQFVAVVSELLHTVSCGLQGTISNSFLRLRIGCLL